MSVQALPAILVLCGPDVPLIQKPDHVQEGSHYLGDIIREMRREASPRGYDVIGNQVPRGLKSVKSSIRRAPDHYVAAIFDLGVVGSSNSMRREIEAVRNSGFPTMEITLAERRGMTRKEFEEEYADMLKMLIATLELRNPSAIC